LRQGKILEFEFQNFPLGQRPKTVFTNKEVQLFSGDWIVLYSDGLVEAKDENGRLVSYDRMLAALPALLHTSPIEAEKAIRKWHRQIAPRFPPEDDVTIVILQLD